MNMPLYAVTNPATGEVVREYPTATDEAVDAALEAAAGAYRNWSRQATVTQRADLLRKVAALHNSRSAELAEIIHREMGKSIDQAAKKFEQVDVRTRAIKKRLSNVHELPNVQADAPTDAAGMGHEETTDADEGDSQGALPL